MITRSFGIVGFNAVYFIQIKYIRNTATTLSTATGSFNLEAIISMARPSGPLNCFRG